MKLKQTLQMLFMIIFRINISSLGRAPNFKDLRHKENVFGMTARECVEKIGIPAMRGLQNGLQDVPDKDAVTGKADAAGPFDFETVARNFQEFAEVMSGRKESDELFITSGFKSKALICKNCGGQIDRKSGKCPFCDTEYDFEEESESYAYLYADDGLVEKIKLGGDVQ